MGTPEFPFTLEKLQEEAQYIRMWTTDDPSELHYEMERPTEDTYERIVLRPVGVVEVIIKSSDTTFTKRNATQEEVERFSVVAEFTFPESELTVRLRKYLHDHYHVVYSIDS